MHNWVLELDLVYLHIMLINKKLHEKTSQKYKGLTFKNNSVYKTKFCPSICWLY